ncbi:RYamide receptor-like [Battus philenor]|uniref:RYamide receptor-like n=1 Tax=Battus philenor TaxID=42288 RepID=UPI0035CF0738
MFHSLTSTVQSFTEKYDQAESENEDFVNNTYLYNLTTFENTIVCIFEDTSDDFLTSTSFRTVVYIMYSAVFVIALTGNGLVCFVVHTSPRMKTVTNYFIVNLAVGDILMTLFCVPFSFVPVLVLRYWPFGDVMCHVVNYSQAVSVLVSAYTLLAISIDRYVVILHPLKQRLGKLAAKAIVIAVWSGALATALPIPIVSQLQKPSLWHLACDVYVCAENWTDKKRSEQYTIALLTLQFALPLTALVGTYARIGYVVWAVRPPGEAQSDRDTRMQSSKLKMIKMMVTVVAVFIVSWLPLNILIMLWTFYGQDEEWTAWPGLPYIWFASHWLAMSHSCYNPIIYCYMNNKYRHGFKQALNKLLCIKMNVPGRSCHKSSICDGVPMSELEGVNGTHGQRILMGNKIRYSRASNSECRCSRCMYIRKGKINVNSEEKLKTNQPPVQILSVDINL